MSLMVKIKNDKTDRVQELEAQLEKNKLAYDDFVEAQGEIIVQLVDNPEDHEALAHKWNALEERKTLTLHVISELKKRIRAMKIDVVQDEYDEAYAKYQKLRDKTTKLRAELNAKQTEMRRLDNNGKSAQNPQKIKDWLKLNGDADKIKADLMIAAMEQDKARERVGNLRRRVDYMRKTP